MSTQSHIDPPADPADGRSPHMSRRSVLRGAAVGAGAVGLATVASAAPALAAARPAARQADAHAAQAHAPAAAPIVVYLRDASSGELEVFAGETRVSLHDPAIAARLTRALR